jgi:hypothetical protein
MITSFLLNDVKAFKQGEGGIGSSETKVLLVFSVPLFAFVIVLFFGGVKRFGRHLILIL